MNDELLAAQVDILSALPVFDEPTGVDLVRRFGDAIYNGAGQEPDPIGALLRWGVLSRERDCWRVVDSVRSESFRRLQNDYPDVYRSVTAQFLAHTSNGFGERMDRVLGPSGGTVTRSVMRLAVDAAAPGSFDEIIDVVQSGAARGRNSISVAVAVLVRQLPEYEGRNRHLDLLEGLELWRIGHRTEAEKRLRRVLLTAVRDRADAIASHLVGAAIVDRGDHGSALDLLERSLMNLRELQDARGLAMVLNTWGIAHRELGSLRAAEAEGVSRSAEDRDDLVAQSQSHFDLALRSFEESITIASELEDIHLLAGGQLELARCFSRMGDPALAIEVGELALERYHTDDPDRVAALVFLGSVHKNEGDLDRAAMLLEEAVESGEVTVTLASALNVLATTERRLQQFERARKHAEQSVALGRRLRGDRHLSQALHTLAVVLIDAATDADALHEADLLLVESEKILSRRHDERGLGMVITTRSSLARKRRALPRRGP